MVRYGVHQALQPLCLMHSCSLKRVSGACSGERDGKRQADGLAPMYDERQGGW